MKKIVIIGCGFAGIAACQYLRRHGKNLEVYVIDKKTTFDFLPLLPDCIGRRIDPQYLSFSIYDLVKNGDVNYVNEEVLALDLDGNKITTPNNNFDFDYCLIASGSETNFYGNLEIKNRAYKVDSVEDIRKICGALEQIRFDNYIICGGGYTGIEIATNLRVFLRNKKIDKKIVIVEKSPTILAMLPDWMKAYVDKNLKFLDIEVLTAAGVDKIEGSSIYISGGKVFDKAMLIWAAGVKTPDYVQALGVEKSSQGRLKVDNYLKIRDNCFVAGDCAFLLNKTLSLRMAVQFAITQGSLAAANILESTRGRRLHKYSPLDLGFVVPMANNRSCGRISGLGLRGRVPTLLHFLMCIFRSQGAKNRLAILGQLLNSS